MTPGAMALSAIPAPAHSGSLACARIQRAMPSFVVV